MVSQTITLLNEQGLHMRPAGMFAQKMAKYKCDVTIIFNDRRINGKSVMNIMAACIKSGSTIEIICSGNDENVALNDAIELIENEFK